MSAEPLYFSMVVRMHLPPALPPVECERIWKQCLQPLIGAIHHTPTVKLGLVLSGDLVQDFQERHPEGLEWVRGLVERGQVELLATALFEPVLSAIPEADAIGQLITHATQMRQTFGVRPTGAWVPWGVWDPVLPRILSKAGLSWTLLDERQLRDHAPEPLFGVWRTEREGYGMALLVGDKPLREMAAEVPVKQVLATIQGRARDDARLVVLQLEAERFGLHPGSNPKRDQSWFATLLAGIAAAAPHLETVRPTDAVARGPQRGRVYLPCTAPREVGVPWERHLARYEEANRLHKRMLRVSRLVAKLEKEVKDEAHSETRPDPAALVQAHRYLYRAQAAPVYWHGPHAGIYDPELRHRAWLDLIRAERVALDALRIRGQLTVELQDADCDGVEEVVLRTPALSMVVDPAHSGGVTELCHYESGTNLADTFTRVEEPYHKEIVESQDPDAEVTDPEELPVRHDDEPTEGIHDHSVQAELRKMYRTALGRDPRMRICFAESFLGPEVTRESLRRGRSADAVVGVPECWQVVTAERHGESALRVMLAVDGAAMDPAGERKVRLHKRYTLHRDGLLQIRQEVTNRSHEALRTRVGLELNLSLGPRMAEHTLVVGDQRVPVRVGGDLGDVSELRIEGEGLVVVVQAKKALRAWCYPVETVHRHQGEAVVATQGVCVVLVWPVEVWGQEKARMDLDLTVESASPREKVTTFPGE